MKKFLFPVLAAVSILAFSGCKKDNYPGGRVSPYIAMFDLRDLYKGSDVTLTPDVMFGSSQITGLVVSDHSGKNLPAGLVAIQDARRLSALRGISIDIGADASRFVPGDSVIVKVEGGTLKRVDGILEITGLTATAFTKVSSGNTVPVVRVQSSAILANPDAYESTLSVIVKGGFNPLPAATDKLSGNKMLNDGFGEITLHTEPAATFADSTLKFLANYYGIVYNTLDANKQLVPQIRPRTAADIVTLSSTVEVIPIVITGFMSDCAGTDGNYEYIQLKATQDINFTATPFSLVVTNNANASIPTGFPANGWATGSMRTYKFNLTSGTAAKGSFFYVGGSGKLINGPAQTTPTPKPASTSIAQANWIRAFDYTTTNGDGFGTATTGLLANSGNASGIAVFAGTTVTAATRPVDAIFIGTAGSLYTTTPSVMGYRIPNSDLYDVKNPITLADQPFNRSGTNTIAFVYNAADLGIFNMLGGEYNSTLGRWTKARAQNNVTLTKTSVLADIETSASTVVK